MKSMTSTSEKILDIAQSLIVAGGYNGFSYADIAAAIGIRKASIHHHFPTKAELVAVLVDRYRQQAETGLQALRAQVASPACNGLPARLLSPTGSVHHRAGPRLGSDNA